MLLAAGADPNVHKLDTDAMGGTALHVATIVGGIETMRILLDHGADSIARYGTAEKLREGSSHLHLDGIGKNGEKRPLRRTTIFENVQVFELSELCLTPIQQAVWDYDAEKLLLLLNYSGDPNAEFYFPEKAFKNIAEDLEPEIDEYHSIKANDIALETSFSGEDITGTKGHKGDDEEVSEHRDALRDIATKTLISKRRCHRYNRSHKG